MGRVHENQVNVGIGQNLVIHDCSRIRRFPLHCGLGNDGHVRKRLHLCFKALLDVERIRVTRITQYLQNFTLDAALFRLEQLLDLVRSNIADLDRTCDRGKGRLGRGDLAIKLDHRNTGRHRLFNARFEGFEINSRQNNRLRLQIDHVIDLALLHIGLVVGIQGDGLIADILHEFFQRLDRFRLEFVEQGRYKVIHLALCFRFGRRRNRACERHGNPCHENTPR